MAYASEGLEDVRFQDYFGGVQSIVASSAQQDSGLFETNLRDERYLPFENAGVISEWQLELPANPSRGDPTQFDYDTITDVVLHIRYTARDGGALLRSAALQEIKDLINAAQAAGAVRLFSLRHEFPGEWARFTSQTPGANRRYDLSLTLRPEHYPFWSQGRLNNVVRVDLFAQSVDDPAPATIKVADRADKTDAGRMAVGACAGAGDRSPVACKGGPSVHSAVAGAGHNCRHLGSFRGEAGLVVRCRRYCRRGRTRMLDRKRYFRAR